MAEGGGLLNRYTACRIEGSNPSSSTNSITKQYSLPYRGFDLERQAYDFRAQVLGYYNEVRLQHRAV